MIAPLRWEGLDWEQTWDRILIEVPMKFVCLAAATLLLSGSHLCARARADSAVSAQPVPSLFDPARHMHVSEVHPGMTGYGLTVFKGSKIEKFDVEVLSVLKDFNPQDDVVLIRCKGAYMDHVGSVAGMSGSPIYLRDAEGRDRMIGAFAYGWPLTKDPVAGVQPIEYMLALPSPRSSPTTSPGLEGGKGPVSTQVMPAAGRATWSMKSVALMMQARYRAVHHLLAGLGRSDASTTGNESLTGEGDSLPRLMPLTTPLMASGLSSRLMDELAPQFKSMGLTMLQSGGGSGGASAPQGTGLPLQPGSVLAVPLLTGDADVRVRAPVQQ
jgi:hypothetical protein